MSLRDEGSSSLLLFLTESSVVVTAFIFRGEIEKAFERETNASRSVDDDSKNFMLFNFNREKGYEYGGLLFAMADTKRMIDGF